MRKSQLASTALRHWTDRRESKALTARDLLEGLRASQLWRGRESKAVYWPAEVGPGHSGTNEVCIAALPFMLWSLSRSTPSSGFTTAFIPSLTKCSIDEGIKRAASPECAWFSLWHVAILEMRLSPPPSRSSQTRSVFKHTETFLTILREADQTYRHQSSSIRWTSSGFAAHGA